VLSKLLKVTIQVRAASKSTFKGITLKDARMKYANAAITLLEKLPEKISGSEWDSNP